MANQRDTQIEEYLEQINKAVRGEEVRDAIIEILKIINQDRNAHTLGGLPPEAFAKQIDMDLIIDSDGNMATEPSEHGTRPVGSGDLYNYLKKAVRALNDILGDGSGDTGTIYDRAVRLAEIKGDLRMAIRELGVSVESDDEFSTYAGKLKNIEPLGDYKFETLNVGRNDVEFNTSSLTYEAELYPKSDNTAYSTVDINIRPNFKTKRITSIGKFTAAKDDCDGFSEVEVALDTSGGGGGEGGENSLRLIQKNLSGDDFPETLSSATFYASNDKAIGYSAVTVNVSDKIQAADIVEIDPGEIEEKTILASDEKLWGFSSVTIKVVEQQGPFKVEFWNSETRELLETVTVEKYASATYSGKTPESSEEGKTFAGWSPDPTNVTRNMRCFAQFRETEHIGFDSEIKMSWDEIGANGGRNIPIGAYKILYVQPFEYDGTQYPGAQYCMMKVYENEEGTTSTWLSTSPLPAMAFYENRLILQDSVSPFTGAWVDDGDTSRPCSLKRFLNGGFMNAIRQSMGNMYGDCGKIVDRIKKVKKYSTIFDVKTGFDPDGSGRCNLMPNAVSYDNYIWVPNDNEIQNTNLSVPKLDTASPRYNLNANKESLPAGFSRSWYNKSRSIYSALAGVYTGTEYASLHGRMIDFELLYKSGTYNTTIYKEVLKAYRDAAIASNPNFSPIYSNGGSSGTPVYPDTAQPKFRCNFGFCL